MESLKRSLFYNLFMLTFCPRLSFPCCCHGKVLAWVPFMLPGKLMTACPFEDGRAWGQPFHQCSPQVFQMVLTVESIPGCSKPAACPAMSSDASQGNSFLFCTKLGFKAFAAWLGKRRTFTARITFLGWLGEPFDLSYQLSAPEVDRWWGEKMRW